MRLICAFVFTYLGCSQLLAQPPATRFGTWLGTNGNDVLCVVEATAAGGGLGSHYSGWLRSGGDHLHLHHSRFSYRDNVFRALAVGEGRTEQVEITYVGSAGDGKVETRWNGQSVIFQEQPKNLSFFPPPQAHPAQSLWNRAQDNVWFWLGMLLLLGIVIAVVDHYWPRKWPRQM